MSQTLTQSPATSPHGHLSPQQVFVREVEREEEKEGEREDQREVGVVERNGDGESVVDEVASVGSGEGVGGEGVGGEGVSGDGVSGDGVSGDEVGDEVGSVGNGVGDISGAEGVSEVTNIVGNGVVEKSVIGVEASYEPIQDGPPHQENMANGAGEGERREGGEGERSYDESWYEGGEYVEEGHHSALPSFHGERVGEKGEGEFFYGAGKSMEYAQDGGVYPHVGYDEGTFGYGHPQAPPPLSSLSPHSVHTLAHHSLAQQQETFPSRISS